MKQYLIIDKEWLEKAIADLKEMSPDHKDAIRRLTRKAVNEGFIGALEVVLEKGKPLQPIIEDTFDAGNECGEFKMTGKNRMYRIYNDKEEYIENLKID